LSVLPSRHLPYRPPEVHRLQDYFDQRAGLSIKAPDPPPKIIEAGCLQRAWDVFSTRGPTLLHVFGQLLPSTAKNAGELWISIRQAKGSLANILRFLAEHHRISLLADYHCLKVPS
jgi:hypothetical protein